MLARVAHDILYIHQVGKHIKLDFNQINSSRRVTPRSAVDVNMRDRAVSTRVGTNEMAFYCARFLTLADSPIVAPTNLWCPNNIYVSIGKVGGLVMHMMRPGGFSMIYRFRITFLFSLYF